jgi:2-amino-4-hydroxy-6-hydroxymethyldihydropteridine diphosphokinase
MRVFLGLGSNLGDREENLASAISRLAAVEGVSVGRRSSLYESRPVGPAQPDFLNAALLIESSLSPSALLAECKRIERELGREPGGIHWGPRPIDIDLLLADRIVAEPALQVPHLELHKRAFAMAPLCELDPEAVHPVFGWKLSAMLADLGDQGVRRVGELYVET